MFGERNIRPDITAEDVLCRQLRSDCEDLLGSFPRRLIKRMHPLRVAAHAILNFVNADITAKRNRSELPVGDKTYVSGIVNDLEKGPLKTEIRTSTLRPISKAKWIEVRLPDSGERLVLGKRDAYIRVEGSDGTFGFSLRSWFFGHGFKPRTREVTLPEAQNWQRVVEALK